MIFDDIDNMLKYLNKSRFLVEVESRMSTNIDKILDDLGTMIIAMGYYLLLEVCLKIC